MRRHFTTSVALLIILTLIGAACSPEREADIPGVRAKAQAARPVLKILFVGNSYTRANNLGNIVASIAAADPNPDAPIINPSLSTRGGATLKWHLENGPALQLIQAGGWDHVVLQEQSLLGGRMINGKAIVGDPRRFFGSVRWLVGEIGAVGATPILYMTWARRAPAADRARVQTQLADAYLTIGEELGVQVAPVGLAWAEAHRRLPQLDLHVSDGSHPTTAGSYLAACVIYATITGRSPVGAPAVVKGRPVVGRGRQAAPNQARKVALVELPAATATELQEIAWDVVSKNP